MNPTEENLREVTTHELAHSLDNNGNASNPQSKLSDYQKFLFRDFFTLDYLSQGSTEASSPPRNACLPVVDEFGIVVAQAPFANTVIEGTTQSVCNNGVLNPRYIDSQTGPAV